MFNLIYRKSIVFINLCMIIFNNFLKKHRDFDSFVGRTAHINFLKNRPFLYMLISCFEHFIF